MLHVIVLVDSYVVNQMKEGRLSRLPTLILIPAGDKAFMVLIHLPVSYTDIHVRPSLERDQWPWLPYLVLRVLHY